MFFFSFQMRKKWSRGPSARDWANISFGKQRKSNPAYGGSWGLSGILSASACHHWTPELMPALINIIHHTINVLWLVNVCIQRCIQYLLISWILIKKRIFVVSCPSLWCLSSLPGIFPEWNWIFFFCFFLQKNYFSQ